MTTLTHLDETGAARMVDVSAKPATQRRAVATGRIAMSPEAAAVNRDHPLPITSAASDFILDDSGVTATATITTTGKTGVEMEAMTAVSVALLTIYDMAKAIDKGMVIGGVRLLEKSGGKSGEWRAP